MEITVGPDGRSPTSAWKLVTVEEDVNVTASISPAWYGRQCRLVGCAGDRAVHREHVDLVPAIHQAFGQYIARLLSVCDEHSSGASRVGERLEQ